MVMTGTSVSSHVTITTQRPGRRYDHVFFVGMALLILVTVFLGFARTYYLAGLFRAPLPNVIVHFHGAAFSCWIFLLVAQTSLIAVRRIDMHRRLGIAGFTLACLMVVLGVWVNNRGLTRGGAPPDAGGAAIYLLGFALLLIFAVVVIFAFHFRSNPAAHKRLILVATVALLPAAIIRLPFALVLSGGLARPTWLSYPFLLMLVLYDLWSRHKVHRATVAAGAFLILTEQVVIALGPTAKSQAFAVWMYDMLRQVN
jgi:hypothetical protein